MLKKPSTFLASTKVSAAEVAASADGATASAQDALTVGGVPTIVLSCFKIKDMLPAISTVSIVESLIKIAAGWHAIASWTWDAQDETCGICRMAFDGCCPDCKLPGDDCPLIWGACNHAFHLHCILKWVNSQTPQAHCPMCRREWQFKE
ncbi:hypothetical protein LguiB_021640 [Lonicera macranthoides]